MFGMTSSLYGGSLSACVRVGRGEASRLKAVRLDMMGGMLREKAEEGEDRKKTVKIYGCCDHEVGWSLATATESSLPSSRAR